MVLDNSTYNVEEANPHTCFCIYKIVAYTVHVNAWGMCSSEIFLVATMFDFIENRLEYKTTLKVLLTLRS